MNVSKEGRLWKTVNNYYWKIKYSIQLRMLSFLFHYSFSIRPFSSLDSLLRTGIIKMYALLPLENLGNKRETLSK